MRGRGERLSISEETKIVALLARGDKHKDIIKQLDEPVTLVTIGKIKKRNMGNLQILAQKSLQKEEADALAIKNKANAHIKQRLDSDDTALKLLEKANQQYLNDDISMSEYAHLMKLIKTATIQELVSISKEMHAQSVTEEAPPSSAQDIAALVAAIKSGDEVQLNQIIFKGDNNGIGQPPIEPSEPGVQPGP